jgi:hypothetical protein
LLLPLTAACAARYLKDANGPYWLGANSDPEYYYLVNALALAELSVPGYYDHPGTTLTYLEVPVIILTHTAAGGADLTTSVFTAPEKYLNSAHYAVLFLWVTVLTLAGGVTFRQTGSLLLALLMQLAPFLPSAGASYLYLPRVCPESLLVPVGILFATVAPAFVERPGGHGRRYASLFGVIVGLAVATKVTAVPLAIVPLVLLPGRQKVGYAAVVVLSALALTAVLLPRYLLFLSYLMRTGAEFAPGAGEDGPARAYFANVCAALGRVPLASSIILLSALVLTPPCLLPKRKAAGDREKMARKGLFAVTSAEVLQLLIAANCPEHRYLAPSLALLGLNLVLVVRITLPHVGGFAYRGCVALAPLLLCSALAVSLYKVHKYHDYLERRSHAQMGVCRELDGNYRGCAVVYYYGASSVPYALWVGNELAGGMFSNELQGLYPDAVFFDNPDWTPQQLPLKQTYQDLLRDFTGRRVVIGTPCLLFQGWGHGDYLHVEEASPGLVLERVFPVSPNGPSEGEVLYRLSAGRGRPQDRTHP